MCKQMSSGLFKNVIYYVIASHIYVWIGFGIKELRITQSTEAVKYTDYNSAEGWNPPQNGCPGYDAKQSDGKVPVMLELWGMWSTPSFPSVSDPLWPRELASDRVLSMCKLELNCVLMQN